MPTQETIICYKPFFYGLLGEYCLKVPTILRIFSKTRIYLPGKRTNHSFGGITERSFLSFTPGEIPFFPYNAPTAIDFNKN